MRIGVELEYWVTDADGSPVPAGDLASAGEGVETEFVDQLLEVKTPPCESLDELREALASRLDRVLDAAGERRLVPLGTPLRDDGITYERSDRIDVQRAILGEDFEHATNCAGAHVHFEAVDPVDQLRVLTALDPAFALVNTTPYHRGERLATCARPYAYRRLCYRSLPAHGQLWRYPESLPEWRERRRARYDTFLERARDAGFDRETVRDAFRPDDAVWAPVRLRDDFGTVEWRAPDAALPSAILRLVADLRSLLESAIDGDVRIGGGPGVRDGSVRIPRFDDLTDVVDVAMEEGLDSEAVVDYLRRFGFEVEAYRPTGTRIDGLEHLSATEARRLRRRAADRLVRDVRALDDADRPVAPA